MALVHGSALLDSANASWRSYSFVDRYSRRSAYGEPCNNALPHVRFLEERAGIASEVHREVGEFFQQMGMTAEADAAFNRAASLE